MDAAPTIIAGFSLVVACYILLSTLLYAFSIFAVCLRRCSAMYALFSRKNSLPELSVIYLLLFVESL